MSKKVQFMVNSQKVDYNKIPKEERVAFERAVYNRTMGYKKHFQTNGEAQFWARLMAYFYPRILLKKYPQFRFRDYTNIVKAAPYAKTVVFEMYDMIGFPKAKNHRAGDIGIVDTIVDELEVPVRSITGGIRWDYVEFKAAEETAAKGGKVQFARMEAMARFFEQELNDWFFFGDTDYGITGILNNPSIPTDAVAQAWTNPATTTQDKLTDLINTYTSVIENSKKVFTPNTMCMSLSSFLDVFGEPRSVYSDETVLSWVETKLPGIDRIIADPFLDSAGPGGTGVIIALEKDPDYSNMAIPMEMVGLPPVFQGTDYVMPFIARSTGFNVIQGDSIYIKTGL